MKEKWIRADELAAEWKMTAIQFVDHLKNDEHVMRNGLIPHNDTLTPIREVSIANLDTIYFLTSEVKATEKERYETNELYRDALKSEDLYEKQHVRQFISYFSGLSDADMDALLTDAEPQREPLSIPAALGPMVAISPDDHIKKRKAEGAKVEVIAVELYDKKGSFKLTDLVICRKLDLGKNLNQNQIKTMKQRGRRARKKGEAMLAKSAKQKKL